MYTINALNELDNETLQDVYQQVNSYNGEFEDCIYFDVDEWVEMKGRYIDRDDIAEILDAGNSDLYRYDSVYGLEAVNDENYRSNLDYWIDDLTEYLVDTIVVYYDYDEAEFAVIDDYSMPDYLPTSVYRAMVKDSAIINGYPCLAVDVVERLTDELNG